MNTRRRWQFALNVLTAAVMLSPGGLLAQDEGGLDVTMRMVTDDEGLDGGLVQELQLPAAPAGVGGERARSGRDRSDTLREQGRSLGQEISEQARGRREEQSMGRSGNNLELPSPTRDRPEPDPPAPDIDPGDRPRPDPGRP